MVTLLLEAGADPHLQLVSFAYEEDTVISPIDCDFRRHHTGVAKQLLEAMRLGQVRKSSVTQTLSQARDLLRAEQLERLQCKTTSRCFKLHLIQGFRTQWRDCWLTSSLRMNLWIVSTKYWRCSVTAPYRNVNRSPSQSVGRHLPPSE